MGSLYEINKAIMECIDTETGEILDEEKLKELSMDRNDKIENTALWIKNLKSEVEALEKEKTILAERQAIKEASIERLKKYLTDALEGNKFETARVALSFRKSESLNVLDETKIDRKFFKEKVVTTISIDKMAIKEAIGNGENVEGAVIVEKQNLQIK